MGIPAYFIYERLNLHVAAPDAEVSEAFADYADRKIKGGRNVLTREHHEAILNQHRDAFLLYAAVMGGQL